jgi:hypothetical protein
MFAQMPLAAHRRLQDATRVLGWLVPPWMGDVPWRATAASAPQVAGVEVPSLDATDVVAVESEHGSGCSH